MSEPRLTVIKIIYDGELSPDATLREAEEILSAVEGRGWTAIWEIDEEIVIPLTDAEKAVLDTAEVPYE